VVPKKPKISRSRDGNFRQLWYRVLVRQAIGRVLRVEESSQFYIFESMKLYQWQRHVSIGQPIRIYVGAPPNIKEP